MLKLNKKGQNTAEYAILIGLVVAVVIAMQTYVKRGVQGRIADEVDSMANQTSGLGSTPQYEPYYVDSTVVTTMNAPDRKTQSKTAVGGPLTLGHESNVNRAESETSTAAAKQDY